MKRNGAIDEMKTRIHQPEFEVGQFEGFVLGGDVGGTNTNIAVAGVRDGKASLLYSAHFESRRLFSLVPAIREALDYGREKYAIEVGRGVVGVAGPVADPERAKPTNLLWTVDAEEIRREFGFDEFRIENDFMILGRGIESLKEVDLFSAKGGDPAFGDGRAVIGAGTGLGKAILVYDGERYRPVPSEGGHADFPVQDQFDLELADFIRGGRDTPASYEDLLSGRGIEGIYDFLREKRGGTEKTGRTEKTGEIEDAVDRAAEISKYRTTDPLCRETFAVYARCFGRCAKNFVLEALATGGLYIAGGIAAKNREVFVMPEFSDEFLNAKKQRQILERTPVYVITNYDVSLYGACNASVEQSD